MPSLDPTLAWMAARFYRREWRMRALGVGAGVGLTAVLVGLCVAFRAFPDLGALSGLGYLAWVVQNLRGGRVHSPRTPWQLRLEGELVHVVAYDRAASFWLADVTGATWVFDGGFDELKGIEGLLTLQLVDGTRLPIHERAPGCHELLLALRARVPLVTRDVDDSS